MDGKIRAEKKNERDERDEELNPKGQHANTTRFLSIKVVVLPYGLYVERDVRTFSLSLSLRSRAARSVQSIHVLLRDPTRGVPPFFFPWQNLINETLNRIEFAIISPRGDSLSRSRRIEYREYQRGDDW